VRQVCVVLEYVEAVIIRSIYRKIIGYNPGEVFPVGELMTLEGTVFCLDPAIDDTRRSRFLSRPYY
jgi:hypothetical protein